MKKLILIAAVCASAIIANASTLNWSYYSEDDSFDGYTVYAINAAQSSTLYSLLAIDGDIGEFNTTVANLGTSVQSGTLTYTDGCAEASASPFLNANSTLCLFMIKDTTGGSTFYYTGDVDVSSYLYGAGDQAKEALFGDGYGEDAVASFSSGTIAAAAPEPTSGLLMLLGMAGLALRRRRA